MISRSRLSHKLGERGGKKWIWIGLAAIPAMRVYYIQEMIAALVIFSVLFMGVATVVLIIFLLDRATERVAAWAEASFARLVHWVVAASKA